MVLYRVSNAFAGRKLSPTHPESMDASTCRFASRCRFLDFSSAKWEMLVTVRNFFRDATSDQSLYDELLVVHPPKRVVGGLTLRF